MKNEKDVLILAIESSCDETAAAVVKNGRTVLSNVINTQIAIHTEYGGVVPEIASRKHIENINPVIREALKEADVTLDDITAIGVTYGPGLVGALLVGVAEAKAIAFATDKPLVGVHHIEGHIAANYIENKELKPPFVALVVSGGHTHLVKVVDYGRYEIIGRTRDDAAGEAFDKVARAIGLGYPGGPKIDKIAKEGTVQDAPDIPAAVYRELYQELTEQLTGLQFSPAQANALLGLLESQCSGLPASTARDEDRDISLYDQLKLTSALAACVSEYLQQADAFSLLDTPAELRREPAFLLYTADFSRIQRFIYTVHTEGALRSLRSRSFFLELLMEHYMDELLDGCGLTRTNIIYSGGGHCYLLLPSTAAVQQTLADWNRAFNGWLNEQFGVQLFLANGWTPCSANDLCNVPAEASPYKALFRRVNAIAEQHKQHPYDAAALRALNRVQAIPDGTRECKVCGNSAQVNAEGLCPCCNRFANLSAQIQSQSIYLVHSTPRPGAFALPGIRGSKRFLSFSNDSGLCADAVRSYTKNRLVRTLSPSVNLFVGDYAASNNIEDLADQSEGIRRIAICRMDVDNLGQAFIAGFEQPDQTDPVQRMKYVNLFRAAAFSRQMSLFFKYHINGLLQGLCVSIVYAGGDDVFLVGAWNHTLQAALRIQKHLRSYTCGALTISAGIAMFNEHYPIRAAAEQTAALEDEAKKLPGKNGAALFDAVPDHTYSWDVLQDKVLGEKLACLEQFFAQFQKKDDDHRGNSMLYNLTDLLRNTREDQVNFARCVYLLARLRPDEKKASPAQQDAYRTFSHNVLDWARDPEQRRQLITAIYIYVYQKRGRE